MPQPAQQYVGMKNLNGVQDGTVATCTYNFTPNPAYFPNPGDWTGPTSFTASYIFDANGEYAGYVNTSGHWVAGYPISDTEDAIAGGAAPTAGCLSGNAAYFGTYSGVGAPQIVNGSSGYFEWLPVVLAIVSVAVLVYFLVKSWDKFKELVGLMVGDDASEPWAHDEDYAEWHEERYGAEPMTRAKNWSRFHGL